MRRDVTPLRVLSDGRARGGNLVLAVALGAAIAMVVWTVAVVVYLYFIGRI